MGPAAAALVSATLLASILAVAASGCGGTSEVAWPMGPAAFALSIADFAFAGGGVLTGKSLDVVFVGGGVLTGKSVDVVFVGGGVLTGKSVDVGVSCRGDVASVGSAGGGFVGTRSLLPSYAKT